MANILPRDKQEQAINCLIEGTSVRSAERLTGVHRDTILRLMVRVGEGCARVLDETMRGLSCKYVQADEIWGYVGKKQRHVRPEDDASRCGDMWTFISLDSDTKIIPAYLVGKRTKENATVFMRDLASRLDSRIQLSTDGLSAYVDAVEQSFGAAVDYGTIVKQYEAEPVGPGRYSPPKVTKTEKAVVMGRPDWKHISTSHVERQNLTMRMSMRRMTRLTNAFSKKLENLHAAVSLYVAHYNLVRVHQSLRVTPAMEAGVTNRLWSIGDLLDAAPN